MTTEHLVNLKNVWIDETDSHGVTTNPNTHDIIERKDCRGTIQLASSWVWAIGKTSNYG